MLWQMITLLAVFYLSSSKTTADFIPVNECENYTTLHEANRSRFFSHYTTKISDDSLTGWFTFNGSAGKHMATSCVPSNHCGTLVPGWMAGTHPAVEEGVAKRFVCFSMKQICCKAFVSMRVRNCSGFYVYKLDMMPSFGYSFRVCGAGIEGSIPFVQTGSKNTSGNANDECLNYNTISERDRAADYFSYHTMKCDANLPQAWYRFTGSAGTVMPTQCVPKMHCGTLSPGWLNGKHPSVGEGVVERMACFTKDDECCFWYSQVLVRNCSDFIVYRFGQFPTAQHFCSLRYCGTGRTGCKDKDGNIYEVGQTWNPNPLFTCKCTPNFHVLCEETQTGCWDLHGNAFADGQEWLSNRTTKCDCSNGKINCTKLARPACTDENGIVREHSTQWVSGACFNCSCADGLISCVKYHVTVQYGLFRVEAVGNCMPCRRPSDDILPTGSGTVSACQVFFQLKTSKKLFRCSNGDFIRKSHVCNGVAECSGGSDEAQCQDVVCSDEDGQVLVLKDVWKVTKCISCQCNAGLLKCKRTLQVNFPGQHDAYVPFIESCEQPTCNTVEFIRERRETCQAIETTKDGRVLLEGDTWEYQGCTFQFPGQKMTKGCPQMIAPLCGVYNGAICCARKCAALPHLATQIRWNMSVCPGELQLRALDDICDMPIPNCLQGNDFCEAKTLCQDEEGIAYFEGATWLVGDCIECKCNNGFISCSRKITYITSGDTKMEHCNQTDCNVVAFLKSYKGICKACTWKNQTLPDGYHWKVNGVDFFCSSEGQRVRPGCYLEPTRVRCTGAFVGIQNLTLISDEMLYLCESGDEIRSLNDRCNQQKDCYDDSDERECAQYYCPFHTEFNLYWERTALNKFVQRNCSEVDPNLGGHFTSRCSSDSSSVTEWNHKEGCYCEKEALLQEFRLKFSLVNSTNLLKLTRELISEAINFTNKKLYYSYLKRLFITGVRLLSPVNQSNDMMALNFSRAIFYTADDRSLFWTPPNSFCTGSVTSQQLWILKYHVRRFACTAPMSTHTMAFCRRIRIQPFLADDFAARPPAYQYHGIKKPGVTQFWNRPVLRLKIDPDQLSSAGEPRGHLSFLPRNITNEVNGSSVRTPFQHSNCTWIEYDVNGTLKITVREVKDEEKERKAIVQGYLELTLSSISIAAVIFSLIILSCLRVRNSERIFVHKNLLLSLCLVYVVMILDTFVFTNRKQTPKLCSAMAVIQHLTHTAIFTWMLVEGIHLYIKLVKVFSVNKLYITYIIIGWGLPAVIVGLIAAIRPETYDMSKTYYKDVMCGSLKLTAEIMRDRCWLHDGEWLYKGPILAILLVNLAIFVVLLRVIFTKISTKYQNDNVEMTKRGLKSVAALLPLLGVTWLLGFVVQWSEVLLYLFIILNSTQGLAFCIFHSILDDQIRESLVRSIRRTRMKHMTRIDRSSIASTSTQLSPAGSINGKENFKHRGDIPASKSYDTKL